MTDRDFIRHALATLAYRAAKTMRGAPDSFAEFQLVPDTNKPVGIVAHMADLFDWALTMIVGEPNWHSTQLGSWDEECARFFSSLKRFDDALASGLPFSYELTRMFQGPIADALTHTGQLAMLRRLHGSPMKGENYTRADIRVGKVTADQTPADPRYEFN